MAHNIKTIEHLRDAVLDAFEKLKKNKIDIQEAGILAKLSESVISGLKTQIEYARLSDRQPSIPFLEDAIKEVKVKSIKYIDHKK